MKRPEGAEGHRNPANELQHLRTGKYHARELFLILKENVQIPMADKISQDEMRFVRRHKTHNHQPITEFPDKNLEDWLKYWLKIFDRAYFFNAVQRAYKGFILFQSKTMRSLLPDKNRAVIYLLDGGTLRPEKYTLFSRIMQLQDKSPFQLLWALFCMKCFMLF